MTVALCVWLLAANPHGNLVDETRYAEVLTKHVADAKVDYAALKKDRASLDAYLGAVAAVTRADFDAASKDAQVAYLLNAYNVYTLKAIVDHYPIKGGWLGGANSIRGISGVWDTQTHATALGKVTLDFIEHDTLRKKYDMPAVHMALVCASKGCPPLRGEPYFADALASQLEDQARAYFASPRGLVVEKGVVKVTRLFSFKKGTPFAADFESVGGWKTFVVKHAPESSRETVRAALAKDAFEWLPYDWQLNDRTK